MSLELTKESKQVIDEILTRYPNKRAAALPVLHVVQKQYGFVPDEAEAVVAEILDVPPVKVREVLSFYTLFLNKEIGQKHLQVCRSISCWLRGAADIIEHINKKLGIHDGETTPDKKFTLTEVECLGDCEHAPMMQLNDDYIGNLTAAKVDEILGEVG
ncbi:MAG: NADH-quinone oxidoreductase subunit NuoE [bacterium]